MIIDKRTKRVKNRGKSSKARKTRVRRTKKSRINRRNRRNKKTKRNKRVQRGGMMSGMMRVYNYLRSAPDQIIQRNKLEAAQVRLAFSKMLISESELLDGFDINIFEDIGLLLTDDELKVSEIEIKWYKWSSDAKQRHPGTKFPPLSITIGGYKSSYKFTFADLKPGSSYRVEGWDMWQGSRTKNFTFDSIEVTEDLDVFNIKLIKSGRIEGQLIFCANPELNYIYKLGWDMKILNPEIATIHYFNPL